MSPSCSTRGAGRRRQALSHLLQISLRIAVLAGLAAFGAAPVDRAVAQTVVSDSPAARARALFDAYWQWTLREYPEIATQLGDHRYDDRLADQSAAAVQRRRAARVEFLDRVSKIDPESLAPADRVSVRVMRYQLEQAVALDKICAPLSCAVGDFWSPVTQFYGPQFSLPQLVLATRFATARDYEAYLKRLDALPTQVDQLIARMETGMTVGWMPAKIAIARVPSQLDAQLGPDPSKSPEYKPFLSFPADIAPSDRERLAAAGQRAIKEKVIPAFRRLRDFYETRYLPAAASSIAASALPPGPRYYDARLATYTTTRLSAKEIHELGLTEVARIAKEMDATVAAAGFKGTRLEFQKWLNTDPRFFYTNAEDMLAGYRDIAKRADAQLPRLFAELPRLPYGVRAMRPEEGDNAEHYTRGAADGSRAGYFEANVNSLSTRPKWHMETRFHVPFGSGRERIDVGLEVPRSAPVRRAARVVLGVVALLGTHGANAVGKPRQLGEEARQLRVGASRNVAIAGEHIFRVGVEETRVSIEPLLELEARAFESGGGDRCIHFLADARDLGESELVYLLGRQAGRRICGKTRVVVARARGQGRRGYAARRRRQVARFVEIAQASKRGDDFLLDRALARRSEAFAIRRRDLGWEGQEWLVLRALRGIGAELCIELTRHARDRDLRRHPAHRHSRLHPRDELVDLSRQRIEALEVRLVVAHRREARGKHELRQRELRAVELRDRRPEITDGARKRRADFVQRDRLLELIAHDPDRDAVRGRERLRVDLRNPVEKFHPCGASPLDGGRRLIGKSIVVAMIAELRGDLRIFAQRPLPISVEQGAGASGWTVAHYGLRDCAIDRGCAEGCKAREDGDPKRDLQQVGQRLPPPTRPSRTARRAHCRSPSPTSSPLSWSGERKWMPWIPSFEADSALCGTSSMNTAASGLITPSKPETTMPWNHDRKAKRSRCGGNVSADQFVIA